MASTMTSTAFAAAILYPVQLTRTASTACGLHRADRAAGHAWIYFE